MKLQNTWFEKVSYDQFAREWALLAEKAYKNVKLPERATKGSAGYDFVSPIDFDLKPGETIRFPTGIRCHMDEGVFLAIFPRSGLGFKYRLQLDNTVGIIDADYYYADNEGQIGMKLTNDSRDGKTVTIHAGDRIAQGVFIPFGITRDDEAGGERTGGFGSTGK